MGRKFTRDDLIKLFEHLVESENSLITANEFRKHLDRDECLYVNQITKEANKNIAYRRVDGDVSEMSDDQFWTMVDNNEYQDLIEENAATDIIKMAKKFNLIG